jgi:hypothetical protein
VAKLGGMVDRLLTLVEVAQALRWDRRSLVRALARHGIGVIGRGRLARLTAADVERLIEAERQPPPGKIGVAAPAGPLTDSQRAWEKQRHARARRAADLAVANWRRAKGRKPDGSQ